MTLLFVLTALLLLVSGLVKLHAAGRVGLGVTVLPLVEVVAGLALLASAVFAWHPPGNTGLMLVTGAVLLIVVSSTWIGRAISRRWRAREESEGARLVRYVKYLSRQDTQDPPGA